ncbi:MAG: hypothetical protein M3R00_04665, partial [Pseudomonadota bacterium]|nr:hypothetical protein [Pseudomonadota bacterium]
VFPQCVSAQLSEEPISLESISTDSEDSTTILRGGKFFAQNCMLCHTMIYLKNDALAKKAGVLYDKMPINRHDWWFGVEPPDLSLIARVHSADWLYTYLHSFYMDPSRKQQNNNLLRDQTNMPNPFGGMQGQQVLKVTLAHLQNMSGVFAGKPRYFEVLELNRQGTMSSEEFDRHIFDVVSFLVYASDPDSGTRSGYGLYVLLFLGLFIVLTYLLKKEYWRTLK